MTDKYMIPGPPEKFEVGMWVEWRSGRHGYLRGIVIELGDPHVIASCGVALSYRLYRKDIERYCPMMPVGEAEEMAREAWVSGRVEFTQRADLGFDKWLTGFCERRAGDA